MMRSTVPVTFWLLVTLSDSESDGNVLQSRKRSRDGTSALAVTEGVCIVVAAASYTTSVFRNKHASLVGVDNV